MRRDDRSGASRIHCLSASTALRAETIAGQEPQLGYPSLAQLLRRVGVADDQEFIVGSAQRDSTLAHATSQCALFGYTPVQAAEQVLRVIALVAGWRDHFTASGVTAADLASLAEQIDGDALLTERQRFAAADHPTQTRSTRGKRLAQ